IPMASFFSSTYSDHRHLHSFPTRRSSDLLLTHKRVETYTGENTGSGTGTTSDNNKTFDYPQNANPAQDIASSMDDSTSTSATSRSEEHTSELQSRENLVCRLLLEKKKKEH